VTASRRDCQAIPTEEGRTTNPSQIGEAGEAEPNKATPWRSRTKPHRGGAEQSRRRYWHVANVAGPEQVDEALRELLSEAYDGTEN